MSPIDQCSVIFSSERRSIRMVANCIVLPVGAILLRVAVCVALVIISVTTRSSSAVCCRTSTETCEKLANTCANCAERQRDVEGKSRAGGVDLRGRRVIQKKSRQVTRHRRERRE